MPSQSQTARALTPVVIAREEQRKQQLERLARQCDLNKYTITRGIIIERGAINHSSRVLTLNLRFLDNDDLGLSAYVHEQGQWYLMERHRPENPQLLQDLKRTFPNLEYRVPDGDGELRSSGFSHRRLYVGVAGHGGTGRGRAGAQSD